MNKKKQIKKNIKKLQEKIIQLEENIKKTGKKSGFLKKSAKCFLVSSFGIVLVSGIFAGAITCFNGGNLDIPKAVISGAGLLGFANLVMWYVSNKKDEKVVQKVKQLNQERKIVQREKRRQENLLENY